MATLESASTTQSWAAARQPRRQLLSFGFALTRSSPRIRRAGTCGWASIRRSTIGTIGSAGSATQKISS